MGYSNHPDVWSTRLINKINHKNSYFNVHNKDLSVDVDLINLAILICKIYHDNQTRHNGDPYYSHPLEVAYIVADYVFKTDILITSILHDSLEDTEITFEIISDIFGVNIANHVLDLTRIKFEDKTSSHGQASKITSSELIQALWQDGKTELIIVKIADRIHNMRTLGFMSLEKEMSIINETIESFIAIATHQGLNALAQDLYELCCNAMNIEVTFHDLSLT